MLDHYYDVVKCYDERPAFEVRGEDSGLSLYAVYDRGWVVGLDGMNLQQDRVRVGHLDRAAALDAIAEWAADLDLEEDELAEFLGAGRRLVNEHFDDWGG